MRFPGGRVSECSRGKFCRPVVTWLILPVVICLSQRLSHAGVSTSVYVKQNCEWLIKSVVIHLIVRLTWITVVILELIHAKSADLAGGVLLSYQKPAGLRSATLATRDNFADRTVLNRRRIIQVSALSTFVGTVSAYRGSYG